MDGRTCGPNPNKIYSAKSFQAKTSKESLVSQYFPFYHDDGMFLPFLTEMMENHRKCPYWTILRKYCPSIIDFGHKQKGLHSAVHQHSIQELLDNTTPPQSIFLFVRCIFMKVIPVNMLGSRHNMSQFVKHVRSLLSIQNRGTVSLDYMLANIKLRQISWLQEFDFHRQVHLFRQTIDFLIVKFIFPLLQSFFYVTDSTVFKHRLLFFRKKTWLKLSHLASQEFIKRCKLKKVSSQWVKYRENSFSCLGVSKVRFLPKVQSLRPIINMSERRGNCNNISINDKLKIVLCILKSLLQTKPEALGGTLLGLNALHSHWKTYSKFIRDHKVSHLFFVKTDIEKCFDTINPSLLLRIVTNLLREPFYRYFRTFRNPFRSFSYLNLQELSDCDENDARLAKAFLIKRETLIDMLKALLLCNVVKIGRQHFVQTLGISQGSSLSSILCGIYYGHMEKTRLSSFSGEFELLIRYVDDYLFITPSRNKAETFLTVMLNGIPEYNCRSSIHKSCTNFHFFHPSKGQVTQVDYNLVFCGIAVNTHTLSITTDFTNYTGLKARDSCVVNLGSQSGQNFQQKMILHVRPKCEAVLFDPDFNSELVIEYNILSIFALCAIKFHCLVLQFPTKRRALNNPDFFVKVILSLPVSLFSYLSKLGKRREILPLRRDVLNSLNNVVFLYKLKQHHNQYKPVIEKLTAIERNKTKLSYIMKNNVSQVFRAIPLT